MEHRPEGSRWRRARRLAGRLADPVPLTPLGFLAAAAGWIAVREFGARRQDLILLVAGYGVGAVVLLAVVVVAATALGLRLSARAQGAGRESQVDAESVVDTGFSLPSLSMVPFVSVRWEWLEPEGVSLRLSSRGGRTCEEAIHGERGEYRRIVRRVVVEDVFGLARVGLRFVSSREQVVLPARGRPPTAPLVEALAGGDRVPHPLGPPDGDLVDMRRYAPGDPMKRVLWKTWARSRNLMVRLPERAVSETRRTLAYLIAADGDEPAAALARIALETGALGSEWRFGADGGSDDARTVPEALSLIVRSRDARARGGEGLGGFLERAARSFGDEARFVVFASARPGRWLDAAAAEAKIRGGRVEVILGVDGVSGGATPHGRARVRHRLSRLLLRSGSDDPGAARASEIDAIVQRLTGAGATVTVVDRPTGKVFRRLQRRRAVAA